MAYKIKNPERTLHKEKSFERRLYKIKADGMEFWSVIPPQKEDGEKLIKSKMFKVNTLKEGNNDGEWFNPTDLEFIKAERKFT